jgi:hypothetical protein
VVAVDMRPRTTWGATAGTTDARSSKTGEDIPVPE